MQKKNDRPRILFFLVFLLITAVLFALKKLKPGTSLDYNVLLIGNAILFLTTLVSFGLYRKGLLHENVQVFLRMIYGGLLLKMFMCVAAAFVYVWIAGRMASKQAILLCFVFYFIYTILEVKALMKLNKEQKHG